MYEIEMPFSLTIQLEDTYITLEIKVVIKEDSPDILIKIEPLYA